MFYITLIASRIIHDVSCLLAYSCLMQKYNISFSGSQTVYGMGTCTGGPSAIPK